MSSGYIVPSPGPELIPGSLEFGVINHNNESVFITAVFEGGVSTVRLLAGEQENSLFELTKITLNNNRSAISIALSPGYYYKFEYDGDRPVFVSHLVLHF